MDSASAPSKSGRSSSAAATTRRKKNHRIGGGALQGKRDVAGGPRGRSPAAKPAEGGPEKSNRSEKPEKLAIELFPEGGELAEGLENRVYFTSRDARGRPVPLKGVVVDDRGARRRPSARLSAAAWDRSAFCRARARIA